MVPVCAAGKDADLSLTLSYGAPEVMASYEARQRTHVATAAADVWALGVIAFELLTGEPVFPAMATQSEISSAILGRAEMPWEGPRRSELLRRLRVFKANVLECLERDPEKRPPIESVVRGWESHLHATTTIGPALVPEQAESSGGYYTPSNVHSPMYTHVGQDWGALAFVKVHKEQALWRAEVKTPTIRRLGIESSYVGCGRLGRWPSR
jgi:serine/threonine protein kinase